MRTLFTKAKPALLALALSLAGAHARPVAVVSLEFLADTSPKIGIYTVASVTRQETPGAVSFNLDLKLATALKGDAPATAGTAGFFQMSKWESAPASDPHAGERILVFFSAQEGAGEAKALPVISHMIPLSRPAESLDLRVVQALNANGERLTDEVKILAVMDARLAAHPGTDSIRGSSMGEMGVPLRGTGSIGFYDQAYLILPADLRAREIAWQDTQQIIDALRRYHAAKHVMPRGDNGAITEALVKKAGDGNPWLYLDVKTKYNKLWELCDPWGTPYRINTANPKFPWAYSCGPDKTDNGGAPGSDDIVSW